MGVTSTTEPERDDQQPERVMLISRLLATLAKSEVEMTGLDHGLATLARAERWAEPVADDAYKAFLNSQRGLVLFRGGRFAEALIDFDLAAARIPDAAGLDKCRVLINRGALFVEMGRIPAARRDLTSCIELARRFGLRLVERISLHNLGCLEAIAGDLPLALKIIDQGLELGGDTQLGIAYLDRSRILLAAGLQREADQTLAAAATQLTRDRSWQDVGEVELTRAESALLVGETAAARRLAARARDRFRRHGNNRWRRNAELVLLQGDLRAGRPPARLLPHARRLADEFAEDGFPLQARTALLLAAEMLERLGRTADASTLASRAGPPRPNDPIPLRLHTRYVRARQNLAEGDRSSAKREIRRGLGELASYQARFGGIDLQTASAIHGTRLSELDLDLASETNTPAVLLQAAERSRATSRRLRAVTPPRDEVVAELLSDLRRTVEELRAREADPTAQPQVAADRTRVAQLQQQLRSRSWQTGGTGAWDDTVSIPRLRELLEQTSSAAVSLVECRGRLHAVVLQGRRSRVLELGVTDVAVELVRSVRADCDLLADPAVPSMIIRAAQQSLRRSLDRLDTMLVAPMLRPMAALPDRLVLMPADSLLTLPWGLLPSLRGRPMVVAPSATAWARAVTAPPTSADGITVLAGPGLDQAAAEAAAISAVWPQSEVAVGAAATPDRLRTAMADSAIVHIAAHGEHQADNPMFSSLQLHGGPVFAYELDQAVRIADHVVLSACDLGKTTIRAGGESLGLTSVLLHLGSRSVVSGVARVNDSLAAEVMVRYHAALAGGADSAEALANACAASDSLPVPFVCFGAAWRAAS